MREEVAVIVPPVNDDDVSAWMNPLVKVSPVPEIPVVEALVAVSAPMNPLIKVSPVPDRLVVDAFVEKREVTVPTVVEELTRVDCPETERVPVATRLVVERLEVEALANDD